MHSMSIKPRLVRRGFFKWFAVWEWECVTIECGPFLFRRTASRKAHSIHRLAQQAQVEALREWDRVATKDRNAAVLSTREH